MILRSIKIEIAHKTRALGNFRVAFAFMGVDGFWPIVSSKGKRVTLDILSDKIIAVDASIWIYQFANALKDAASGEQIKASHIVGFFKRICKLLFLRIKPVFVFDGPPIPLKFAALRKRHDDTVPDSVFRKAAQQLLMQNLQRLKTSKQPNQTPPQVEQASPSESSVDEIHVLTESDDDGSVDSMSPSRRLRLTVPVEFRGFMAERRSLDSVSLPVDPNAVSPERPNENKRSFTDYNIDAHIDEDALKDLPLHEQYRGLLQTRSALLSQGRRKALHLATQLGTSVANPDLHALSEDQIKSFVDLARITDLTKSVRMKMSQDEFKEEVYEPPSELRRSAQASSSSGQTKRRRKKGEEQVYDSFGDQHSVLTTARTTGRNELLFGKPTMVKTDDSIKMEESIKSDDSSEEEDLKAKLFGSGWDDVVADVTQKGENETKIDGKPMYVLPQQVTSLVEREIEPEAESSIEYEIESRESEQIVQEEIIPELEPLEEPEESESVSVHSESSISVSVHSESSDYESETGGVQIDRAKVPIQDAPTKVADRRMGQVETTYLPTPTQSVLETISDDDLRVFVELEDTLGAFIADSELTAFDNKVRARISMDSGDTYEEIQELLTAFGIPWVSSPADAEAQCAFLCAAGLVDGVISDDSDTLIYGSPIVFRHLYMGDSTVEMFKLGNIGFDRNELISLALLLGCDFTEGVRGIGPVNASEIVRHYSGLPGLALFRAWCERAPQDTTNNTMDAPLEDEDITNESLREFKKKHANYRTQWIFPEDFPSEAVWNVFDQPVVSHDMEAFSWAVPDEEDVIDVVTQHTDMNRAQAESILSTTMTKYRETRVQRRITDYFSPVFERGAVAEVISKRLKAALAKQSIQP